MKVGILTWGRNLNYGGTLQALATVRIIQALGHEAELIDYIPEGMGDCSYKQLFHDFSDLPLLKRIILDGLYLFVDTIVNGSFWGAATRIRKFKKYFKHYLPFSHRQYRGSESLRDIEAYDLVLVGSDQLWNPKHFAGKSDYLLKWLADSVPRVSYATSVAASTLGAHEEVFRRALKKFFAISVREKSSVALLQPLVLQEIKCVADPTQLLSAEEWSSIFHLRKDANSFDRVVYKLTLKDDDVWRICQDARESGRQVLILTDLRGFECGSIYPRDWIRHLRARMQLWMIRGVRMKRGAGPDEFLSAIRNAKEVWTDSFHALMFATIFDRPVKIDIPPERKEMSSRLIDFLSAVGISGKSGLMFLNEDNKDKLACFRKDSMAWIGGALKGALK